MNKTKTYENTPAGSDCPATTCSPFWYAVRGFFATPLLVVILLLGAVVFSITWPLIPVLLYLQRKEEISKANANVEPPSERKANA